MNFRQVEIDLTKMQIIVTAERQINLAASPMILEDTISQKFLTQPIDHGPAKGSVVDLAPMLERYYKLMGWNENGIPRADEQESLNNDTR